MITFYYRTIKDKRTRILKKAKRGTWINVVDPTEKEVRYLEKQGIHITFIEDALDPNELPRIEKENGATYIMLNVPHIEEERVLRVPLLVVVIQDAFVTISKRSLDWLKVLLGGGDVYTTQKTKNLIRVCLRVNELYAREIRRINKEISVKKVSLSKLQSQDIIALVELEEALNEFISSLVPLIGIFEKILIGKYVRIFEEDKGLIEDLIIDSRQSLDVCKTSAKKIVNIREAYSAILGNSLNKVMKILASLTLIMGVSNIIAGFYGMNVGLPVQSHPLAFFYIFAFSIILSLILVLAFYFKKWL